MGEAVSPHRHRAPGQILLDTHAWLWHLDGDESRFPAGAVDLLRERGRERLLAVSDISAWEVATKVAKGKLTLALETSHWIARAERAPGIAFVRLDRQILVASASLPGALHGDPADRILVATSLAHGFWLATADQAILDYARSDASHLRAIDLRLAARRR